MYEYMPKIGLGQGDELETLTVGSRVIGPVTPVESSVDEIAETAQESEQELPEWEGPRATVRAGPGTQLPLPQEMSWGMIAFLTLLGIGVVVPVGYFSYKWWKSTEVPEGWEPTP